MMGSLDRAPILDGLVAAIDGPVVTEPKLDGLAARSVYNHGRLRLVAARGDGRTGEDVTDRSAGSRSPACALA